MWLSTPCIIMILNTNSNIMISYISSTCLTNWMTIYIKNACSVSIITHHESYYYYSWLKLQRSKNIVSKFSYILVHILFSIIFKNLGAEFLLDKPISARVKTISKEKNIITFSRGPMVRKKWSRNQISFKNTHYITNFEISYYSNFQILLKSLISNYHTPKYIFLSNYLYSVDSIFNISTKSLISLNLYFKLNILPFETNLLQLSRTNLSLVSLCILSLI